MWQYFRLQHTVFYSDLSRAQNMVWVKIEGKIISKHEPLWLLIEMICRETKITLSYGEVQVTEGNKKYCKCMKETQGKLTLIQVSARLESSGVNLVVAPDLQMRWGSSRPWDKRGPSLKNKNFSALRASIWSNNKGGPWPVPWICHCNCIIFQETSWM